MDPHAPQTMNGEPVHSQLWIAARDGNTPRVRYLIEQNADVNELDDDPDVPNALWNALCYKNFDIIAILLKAGADARSTATGGASLIHYAVGVGNEELMFLLLDHGANVSQRDHDKNTAIHGAAYNDRSDMILTLLDLNADINATNKDGQTPLHAAAIGGAIKSVTMLISCKARLDSKNISGRTAMDEAHHNGHRVVRGMLETEETRRRRVKQPRDLAFMMGSHSRLGKESAVNGLDPDVAALVLARMGI
jgi:ankyrin repeat protein